MKKAGILFGLLFVFAWGTAQELKAEGTHFMDGIQTEKWRNDNGSSFTEAKYKLNTGISFVKLTTASPQQLNVAYRVENEKGSLEIRVVDPSGKMVWSKVFTETSSGSFKVDLPKNQTFQLQFVGIEAKGAYRCDWNVI